MRRGLVDRRGDEALLRHVRRRVQVLLHVLKPRVRGALPGKKNSTSYVKLSSGCCGFSMKMVWVLASPDNRRDEFWERG